MQTRIRRKETNHNFYTYDCEGEDETEGAVSERAVKESRRGRTCWHSAYRRRKQTVSLKARRCHLHVNIRSAHCAVPILQTIVC